MNLLQIPSNKPQMYLYLYFVQKYIQKFIWS